VKLGKAAKTYTLATQGIFSMVVFLVIGFLIGWFIDKNSAWPVILAVVGLFIGLFSFITYLLYLLKDDDKNKKNAVNEEKIDDEKEE
jgi:F0F1-type ATP synthase assembly protein I